MAPIITPVKSFINIRSGMKSVISGLGALTTKTIRLNSILLRKTKVKRESIAKNYILSQRREESARRRDREDLIESSSIGGVFKRQAKAIASSTKGFLGRIMDFLGTLLVGWLMYNLPSIITMAQELIGRIQRLYTIATGFFNSTMNMFRGFGNVLGAISKNILTFDFTDSKGRVNNAVKDLNGTFDDMQSQFDEAFKLLTTSLGEGIATGKNAEPFGTEYPNQSMQEQPSASPSSTSGDRAVSGDSVDKKVLDFIADGEASQSDPYGGFNASRGKTQGRATDKTVGWLAQNAQGAIGRYQHMPEYILERAQASGFDANTKFTPEVQDKITLHFLKTSHSYDAWKSGKLSDEDFLGKLSPTWRAIPQGPKNAARLGGSPNSTYNDRYAGGNASKGTWDQRLSKLKSVKTGATQQERPTPRTPTPAQTSTIPSPSPARGISTTVRDEIDVSRNKSPLAGLTPGQGYLARGGRHKGIDIGTYGEKGFYVSLKLSGTVDYIGWDKDGYGNFVDIKSGNAIYRFAHLAKVMVKRGQPYNGETIGEIGTTGRSSSEHLHYEVLINGKDVNPKSYLGLLSIGRQLTGLAGQPAQIATSTPTPAQIASTGTQQRRQAPQNLTQNKPGPTVVVLEEEPPPPAPQSQVSSGGGGIIPIIINPLNSFITQKLLLDLAYT
jgi:murein DD-endopeptidase MepM/ murein hydrolase activator NlpD